MRTIKHRYNQNFDKNDILKTGVHKHIKKGYNKPEIRKTNLFFPL